MDQILGVKTHKLAKDTRTEENKGTENLARKEWRTVFNFLTNVMRLKDRPGNNPIGPAPDLSKRH